MDQKNLIRHPDGAGEHRGYSEVGRENANALGDVREAFGSGTNGEDPRGWKNYWLPASMVPGFKDAMLRLYDECAQTSQPIVRVLAFGKGLKDPEELADMFKPNTNHLRLLHDPAHPDSVFERGEKERLGSHQDFSAVTLLFQDDVGGLKVMNPYRKDGSFVNVPPIDGSIVVSIGVSWQRWSNGQSVTDFCSLAQNILTTLSRSSQSSSPSCRIAAIS